MRVTIFDYGAGNLHSLTKALATGRAEVVTETNAAKAVDTDVLVLPGVGAFGSAAERLAPGLDAMRRAIADGLPTLGICLGMQLLHESSSEGSGEGLGVFRGKVDALVAARSPQIGWNTVDDCTDPLGQKAPLRSVYYANGFVCRPADLSTVTAWSTHEGDRFPAIIRDRNVVGVQFHPEKSSRAGVRWVQAFLDEARR